MEKNLKDLYIKLGMDVNKSKELSDTICVEFKDGTGKVVKKGDPEYNELKKMIDDAAIVKGW